MDVQKRVAVAMSGLALAGAAAVAGSAVAPVIVHAVASAPRGDVNNNNAANNNNVDPSPAPSNAANSS